LQCRCCYSGNAPRAHAGIEGAAEAHPLPGGLPLAEHALLIVLLCVHAGEYVAEGSQDFATPHSGLPATPPYDQLVA